MASFTTSYHPSYPSSSTVNTGNRLKADETAFDLFQRLQPCPKLTLRFHSQSQEVLNVRDHIEVLAQPTEVPEVSQFLVEIVLF